MCKRNRNTTSREQHERPYEGETIQLDAQVVQNVMAQRHSCGMGHFPWWTLWLIWPMIMLMKWGLPLLVGTVTSLWAALNAITIPLLPVLIILLGLALLRGWPRVNRTRGQHDEERSTE